MFRVLGVVCIGVLAFGFTTYANAVLIGRLPATANGTDYQAYYDTVLDITWLKNANLAASNTFGLAYNTYLDPHPDDSYPLIDGYFIYADGSMNWGAALHWIDAMNADGGMGYLGYNDWRLPTMLDTGASGCDFAYTGTDCGYNVQTGNAATTVYSELASLWYDTLGNLGYVDNLGNAPQLGWGLSNTGPFSNLQLNYYWSGLESRSPLDNDWTEAWTFYTEIGRQDIEWKQSRYYSWAVRTGDVSTVPIPTAVWLFGSGLFGLAAMARRKKAV